MPDLYSFRARDAQGALVNGRLRSADRDGVLRYLDEQQLIPISVAPLVPTLPGRLQALLKRGPSLEERILFTRKFQTLYRAGVPILRALSILADQERNTVFRGVLLDVHRRVEGGVPLWEALSDHGDVFGDVFVQSVRSGEASGKLDAVLGQIAEFMEREMTTREEVRAALRYPFLVVFALTVAFLVVVTFVIPKFAAVYGRYGAGLPVPTRILIGANRLIVGHWYWLLPLLAGAGYGVWRYLKTDAGMELKDRWLLRLPGVGVLFLQVAISRFAHMLAILFESGLPMIEALRVVAQSVGNRIVAGEVIKIGENFRGGRNAMERLENGGVFPPLAIQMISVGLETGALGQMLNDLARHYDREVKYASRRLTNVLEPFLIFGLSGLVLLMALAVLLPMWNLISVFKQ